MTLPRKGRKTAPAPKTAKGSLAALGLNDLKSISPLNTRQERVWNNFRNNHLILDGSAGTGKSFSALYLALRAVENKDYTKVIIVRSTVSGREMGFLPGKPGEKVEEYEAPYASICSDLFGRADAYQILKQKAIIEFRSTAFNRGLTFNDTIIIVDEVQNMSYQEIATIATRVGENTKLIICGDVLQDDLTSERFKEFSGIKKIINILQRIENVRRITFGVEDIVRSGFVKDFIIAEQDYNHPTFIEDDSAGVKRLLNERVDTSEGVNAI